MSNIVNLAKIDNVQFKNHLEIVEDKLRKMKKLNEKIKILQAEHDLIKSQLINEYFITHREFRTGKGLLLATYQPINSSRFNQIKLKLEHPDFYKLYCEEKIEYRFYLK